MFLWEITKNGFFGSCICINLSTVALSSSGTKKISYFVDLCCNKQGRTGEKKVSKASNYRFVWYKMLPSAYHRSSFPGTEENRLHVIKKVYSLSNTLGIIKNGMIVEITQLLRKVH